ncbi:MAG: hypothetical protein AAGJ82_06260 [Bacteroidota bacterium]
MLCSKNTLKSSWFLFVLVWLVVPEVVAQDTLANNSHYVIGGMGQYGRLDDEGADNPITLQPEQYKFTTLTISPYFAYRLRGRWLVGVELNYSYSTFSRRGTISSTTPPRPFFSEGKTITFGPSLFARFIVNPYGRLQFYGQPSLGWTWSNPRSFFASELNSERLQNTWRLAMGLGAQYQITPRWRLLLVMEGLSFRWGKVRNADDLTDYEVRSGASVGLSMNDLTFGAEFQF